MLTQTFLNFWYTHTMFEGNFDSSTWITTTLFGFVDQSAFNATEKTWFDGNVSAIVNDVRYGMSTERNLTIWIAATLN